MSFRPNFTGVEHIGGSVVVGGRSDTQPPDDILVIQVLLSQHGQTVHQFVEAVGEQWSATLPAEGFTAGPAIAVGVETRRENATTITWAEAVEIPQPPD